MRLAKGPQVEAVVWCQPVLEPSDDRSDERPHAQEGGSLQQRQQRGLVDLALAGVDVLEDGLERARFHAVERYARRGALREA